MDNLSLCASTVLRDRRAVCDWVGLTRLGLSHQLSSAVSSDAWSARRIEDGDAVSLHLKSYLFKLSTDHDDC